MNNEELELAYNAIESLLDLEYQLNETINKKSTVNKVNLKKVKVVNDEEEEEIIMEDDIKLNFGGENGSF
jgi:hypothetical protein